MTIFLIQRAATFKVAALVFLLLDGATAISYCPKVAIVLLLSRLLQPSTLHGVYRMRLCSKPATVA